MSALKIAMSVDIPGLVGLIVFYVIILVVGLVVGRKFGKSSTSDAQFLANRDFGLFVASFTLSGKKTKIEIPITHNYGNVEGPR